MSISVVIPAYNAGCFIAAAIESALAQTIPLIEVLVIDDGSTDDTFRIASSYPGPVRALTKANGGPASARNLGVQHARGEWIAFLDADDRWFPNKLEKQMELIDPAVAVVHAGCLGRSDGVPAETTFAQLWRRNCIVNSTALVRRSVFIQLGGLDEDPQIVGVEDYNLWLRIAAAGWKICGLSEELCVYTPAEGSLSRQILRFASAELENARKIAGQLNLSPDELREKELLILDQYGFELLHVRDLQHARQYFSQALVRHFTFRRLLYWVATLIPRNLLDIRRRIATV